MNHHNQQCLVQNFGDTIIILVTLNIAETSIQNWSSYLDKKGILTEK